MRAFLRASFAEKERNNSKKEKKHHMPDVCRAYDVYEAYEVWKRLFLTPSTARGAVPLPRRGRSWGFVGQGLRPCRRLHIGSLRSPLSPFARPYGGRRCNRRLQIHLTVAMMQPSVANTSHSCNFPPRCRGAHRAPADILQTLDFPSPKTSLLEGGGPPAGGGRSSNPVAFTPNIFFLLTHTPDT